MPSPFPGMDPYLEDPWLWPDFHLTFVVNLRSALLQRVPRHYAVLADAAPVEVGVPSRTEKGSPYLKIVDRTNRRLITVVELLSPANKAAGKDRDAFLLKRGESLASGVNLVEIDLLRKGDRPAWESPPLPATDYYVMVSRPEKRPKADAWPFSVRDPLPTIPIPLSVGDPAALLPLGEPFAQTFDSAGYDRELDYSQPPNPPLDEPDATWARDLLAARLTPPTTTQGDQP